LFVLVDTLRADRLGSYGYERETSPNLDALAATGVRFAQQISQSSRTKCSMASLWNGLYSGQMLNSC
jgi:arylsulfatase A-like enzyme